MWRLLTSSRDDRGARAARRSLEISFFRQDAISGLVGDVHKGGGVSVASNVFDTFVGSRMPSPCIAVRRAAAIDERARTAPGLGSHQGNDRQYSESRSHRGCIEGEGRPRNWYCAYSAWEREEKGRWCLHSFGLRLLGLLGTRLLLPVQWIQRWGFRPRHAQEERCQSLPHCSHSRSVQGRLFCG